MDTKRQNEKAIPLKCSSCGGTLEFSPHGQDLKCTGCGKEEPLDITPISVKTYPLEAWDDDMAHTDNAVLPFAIGQQQCKEAYRSWLKKIWLAPSNLKKNIPEPVAFSGSYIPFYVFDAESYTIYTGKRGMKDSDDGTSWKKINGELAHDIHNLLIPAVNTEAAKMATELKRWNFKDCVACREAFFSGFEKVQHTKSIAEAQEEAYRKMDLKIKKLIKTQIGGDAQKITEKEISYKNVLVKLIYLPVWTSSYPYKKKVYQFVVNGTTDEINGHYPYSTTKMAIFWTILAVVLLFVIYIISQAEFD